MYILPPRSTRLLIPLLLVLSLLPFPVTASEAERITPASVIGEMNRYRTEAGLAPLRQDDRLQRAAEDRMHEMEQNRYWGHKPPDGSSPFRWLSSEGYDYESAGENLAAGFETVDLLVASWMESPGHRDNILSRDFDQAGVAVIEGGTTGRLMGRSVVVLFAREARADGPVRSGSPKDP